MASFDVETFVKAQGQSATGALTSVGTAFGLPTCMLNLGANVLRLLPTSVLASMNLSAQLAKSRAQEIIDLTCPSLSGLEQKLRHPACVQCSCDAETAVVTSNNCATGEEHLCV